MAHQHKADDRSVAAAQAFARHCLRQDAFVGEVSGFRNEDGVRTFLAGMSVDRSHAIIATGPAFAQPRSGGSKA